MTTRQFINLGDISRLRPRPHEVPAGSRQETAGLKPPVPASAAWEPGDPIAGRQFAKLAGGLSLESGATLPEVIVAYKTYGQLNAERSNAVLILHALTGDAHVSGPAAAGQLTSGWWDKMVGAGKPIDTDKYFVVVPNVLGGCQGTTGPSSYRSRHLNEVVVSTDAALLNPRVSTGSTTQWNGVSTGSTTERRRWGGDFPRLTIRDQVAAEIGLAKHLGIKKFELVIGASMGGLRALEWAIIGPENGIEIKKLAAIATTAATSADQIAWAHPQLAAIRLDPYFNGGQYYDAPDDQGPHRGLAIARQIAHTTYRSADELDERFHRFPQQGENPLTDGRYAVQSYLDHHGDKLARRFDANTYIVLTEAMLTHDLGRDRGGTAAALKSITAETLVVAVDSDRLYPVAQSEALARNIPNARLAIVKSRHGHDGFLIEHQQLAILIENLLNPSWQRAAVPDGFERCTEPVAGAELCRNEVTAASSRLNQPKFTAIAA